MDFHSQPASTPGCDQPFRSPPWQHRIGILVYTILVCVCGPVSAQSSLPLTLGPFRPTPQFGEQESFTKLPNGVRVYVNAPMGPLPVSSKLVIYACPNGNSLEQTLGAVPDSADDWQMDIQHVAAQMRAYRSSPPIASSLPGSTTNSAISNPAQTIYAVVEAPGFSWPLFRSKNTDANPWIKNLIVNLKQTFHSDSVVLAGHSGGGSFLFGFMESQDSIPDFIDRFIILDANYAYSDALLHGDKLLRWLNAAKHHQLCVLAYDDREILLNGTRVIGPDGGTFRATRRMRFRLERETPLSHDVSGLFDHFQGMNGQIDLRVHRNPENKILHTALVGEINGLLWGLHHGVDRTSLVKPLGTSREYAQYISSEPPRSPESRRGVLDHQIEPRRLNLPVRPPGAPTATELLGELSSVSVRERENRIAREILSGNVPEHLRRLVPVRVKVELDSSTSAVVFATVDYLGVGSDDDWIRFPLTPHTCWKIAEATETVLPTRKLVDDLWSAATFKLVPKPLTTDRELIATFRMHHQIIDQQLVGVGMSSLNKKLLIAGIKKDVVWSNALNDKPDRVAIYGWHYKNGQPIQPLYTGHTSMYVDYSHGVRLVAKTILLEDQERSIREILEHPEHCKLLSDEGPLRYNAAPPLP